jgi:hypothetical protein
MNRCRRSWRCLQQRSIGGVGSANGGGASVEVAARTAVEHRWRWQLRAVDEERRVKARASSPSSPMVSPLSCVGLAFPSLSVGSGNCESWQRGAMAVGSSSAGDCNDMAGDTHRLAPCRGRGVCPLDCCRPLDCWHASPSSEQKSRQKTKAKRSTRKREHALNDKSEN